VGAVGVDAEAGAQLAAEHLGADRLLALVGAPPLVCGAQVAGVDADVVAAAEVAAVVMKRARASSSSA
jgi:hypothetical protein